MTGAIYDKPIPRPLQWLGARWRDRPRSFRMKWGEISFGAPGFALELCLFGDRPHYSLEIHALRTKACGYDLKPGETPLQCLRRMQSERRFT